MRKLPITNSDPHIRYPFLTPENTLSVTSFPKNSILYSFSKVALTLFGFTIKVNKKFHMIAPSP